jgi:hypothetical protein
MLQITETVVDSNGHVLSRTPLVLRFPDDATAVLFLRRYLPAQFANGRWGYDNRGCFWWACSDIADANLHRFTIEPEA